MAALILIALAGCLSTFASTDWYDDPDPPDAGMMMMAQPAALEGNVLSQKRAPIPRQIDIFGAQAPGVYRVAATAMHNFYSLHKHIRERAPPPLVQLK
jgi:hypothetical protein